MLEKMVKVEIAGSKKDVDRLLREIYKFGILHLEELPKDDPNIVNFEFTEEETEKLKLFKSYLNDLKEILQDLNLKAGFVEEKFETQEVGREVERLREEYRGIVEEERRIRQEERLLKDYRKALSALRELLANYDNIENVGFIGITISKSEARILEYLKDLIKEKIGDIDFEIISTDLSGDRLAGLVVAPKEKIDEISELIWKEGISELKIPEKYRDMTVEGMVEALEADLAKIPEKLEENKKKLEEFKNKYGEKLKRLLGFVQEEVEILEAKSRFMGQTKFLYFLWGWVPQEEYREFEKYLKEKFGNRLVLKDITPKKEEYHKVPVKFKNLSIFRPFQLLLTIFQPPIYGTIDPTPLLYFFFPIYFGFMLGDFGYGSVAFLLFGMLYLKSGKNSPLRQIATIFLWTSFWSIVFGILYGEAFGDLSERLGMHPLLIHRMHEIKTILVVAVVFGVVQVILGVFLGFINNLRLGHTKHAKYEFARFVGLTGLSLAFIGPILMLIGGWQGYPGILIKVGVVLLVLSVPAVAYLHNFVAPIEILSAMGNMFSFARLMAIGLSSAILGMIANMFGGLIPNLIFGFTVALLFHSLNMILGIFDPTIQGLRLQFVEFFSKFYISGGKKYNPFKKGGSHGS